MESLRPARARRGLRELRTRGIADPPPAPRVLAAIDEPLEHEDPSDRLLDVETQLTWLRELGYDDVDCYWKWLEMALLVGLKPAEAA